MTLKIETKNRRGRWNISLGETPLGYIKKYGSNYHVFVELNYYQEWDLDIKALPTLKEAKDFVRQNLATKESFAQSVASAVANRKFA